MLLAHWTRDYKSWVNDNAYQACHSQRYEPDWAWLGKVHINETLQTRAEFAKPESRKQQFDVCHFNHKVQVHASYVNNVIKVLRARSVLLAHTSRTTIL